LEFRFTLPDFIEHISSYHWILVIHRHGDGNPPQFSGGEILINEMCYTQAISKRMRTLSELNGSTALNHPDYFKDSIAFTRPKRKAEQSQSDEENYMTVTGSVTLATLGTLNITAATLCLTYWPDRDIPNAYAEIELQEINV